MSYVKGTKAGKNEKPVKKSNFIYLTQPSTSKRIKKTLSSKLEEEDTCTLILKSSPNFRKESPIHSIATTSRKLKSEREELSEKPRNDLYLYLNIINSFFILIDANLIFLNLLGLRNRLALHFAVN